MVASAAAWNLPELRGFDCLHAVSSLYGCKVHTDNDIGATHRQGQSKSGLSRAS